MYKYDIHTNRNYTIVNKYDNYVAKKKIKKQFLYTYVINK